MAPIMVSGNSFMTSLKFIFPALIKVRVLVKDPIELASLFVARAVEGGSPVNSRAGIEMSPPPPTTESMNAAIKPASIKNSKV